MALSSKRRHRGRREDATASLYIILGGLALGKGARSKWMLVQYD
jgi:hypothetical protein